MGKKVGVFLISLLLFAVAVMLIGGLLNFVPTRIRDWLGYIVIPLAVLWFLYYWLGWHSKQVGDRNELEWLDELVQEQESGTRDNTETLKRLIPTIEREHEPTPEITSRLEQARRALRKKHPS